MTDEPETRTVDDRHCLAFAMQAEANSQSDDALIGIGQVVLNKAIEGQVTVCYIVTETSFLSVYPWAKAHPDSWQWARFKYGASARHDLLAAQVYAGTADRTDGLRHFNGLGYEDPQSCAKIIDHTCFK